MDEVRNRVSGYFEIISSDETPLSAKILLLVAIVYFLSPIDLIPDFIPVFGYLDDLIIVPFLIWLAFKQIEAARLQRLSEQRREITSVIATVPRSEK
ncbi:MAG: YkvA family protein [Candidatus Riflebacteria bacterium]|nr:YkvA family protein [Candidatus Riflebacteria bacterium]